MQSMFCAIHRRRLKVTSKEQLLKDLNYCKDSLERLIEYAERQKEESASIQKLLEDK